MRAKRNAPTDVRAFHTRKAGKCPVPIFLYFLLMRISGLIPADGTGFQAAEHPFRPDTGSGAGTKQNAPTNVSA